MKKVLHAATVLMLLTIAVKSNAQKGLFFSVKGIPQFAWTHNSDDKNIPGYTGESKFRSAFGIGAQYNFTANAGLGTDVLFSLQGKKYTLNGVTFDQVNDYVKIPVYMVLTSNEKGKISFVGKLGPQFSILSSSKLKSTGKEVDTKNFYKNFNFGAATSAGIQLAISKNVFLSAGLRFDYDFTNAEDDKYSTDKNRASSHNSTLGLDLGVKFRIM